MKFTEIIEQIESQLEQLAAKEEANRQEQIKVSQCIEELNQKIINQEKRRNELDQTALNLCLQVEELKDKKAKIIKIQSLSTNFQDLQSEIQGNQELLDTLYSSISAIATTNKFANTHDDVELEVAQIPVLEEISHQTINEPSESSSTPESETDFEITIDVIKAKLPNAERVYQNLVAKHLEQYHTYQNLIIDGLDLIWCSVAFVAFGKQSYKQMSLRHHPDRDPDQETSAKAMQLINTAWEISQTYSPS